MRLVDRIDMFRLLFWVLVFTLVAGCTAHVPAGKWEVDEGMKKAFEAGTVFPDHTYYYLGSVAAPDSIIAINNRFTLRTRVWAQIDITEQRLTGWLNWYRTENFTGCAYYGGVILAPDGQQAGIWYSQNIINIIQMPEPGVLEVFQPHSPSGTTCGAPSDGVFSRGIF